MEGKKDNFIISRGGDILLISWDNSSNTVTILDTLGSMREISSKETISINDTKVDASGRLWFGTFSSTGLGSFENGVGGLYSLEEDGIKTHVEGVFFFQTDSRGMNN